MECCASVRAHQYKNQSHYTHRPSNLEWTHSAYLLCNEFIHKINETYEQTIAEQIYKYHVKFYELSRRSLMFEMIE